MPIKKTKLLVVELRVIADTLANKYCKAILIEAAQRLEDTDKIATFYRNKVEQGKISEAEKVGLLRGD